MKQDPEKWQTFRSRVPERQRESSQESQTKECTPSSPVDLQRGSKRKVVYQDRKQASLETGQNFKSEEHKRDDDIPRRSVFQRLDATVRPRQKKRRTIRITEEGMQIYTCYASNINLPAIADQAETSNMEQHPTISNHRKEQARAWLDRVNVEVDLPHQNEGGMGASDIATTSNHPLDQGRLAESPNSRGTLIAKSRNGNARKSEAKGYVGKPYATIGNGGATATTTITTTTASTTGTTNIATSATSTSKPASVAYSGTLAWERATKYTLCRIYG
ncbi:hypothetical protein Taro_007450 [Colocasia esculenta]|uniref:Uncharacterized protein n=1 Tax=Colocasia esculenta TaxID=4460 RepID=A0A843U3W3_COLES|nr:hypothetical protein [Colocasia esculenta]